MRASFPKFTTTKLSDQQKKLLPKVGLGFTIALLTGASAFFYIQYRREILKNPSYEVSQVIQELQQIMELPEGVPTLATVTEKEKLQQEGFFKHAQNGDKVLIYLEQGRAILYRPSSKKIIDVAPVQKTPDQSDSPTPATKAEAEQPLTLAIYNGTTTPGLTKKIETDLSASSFELTVSTRENAQRSTYQKTVVVDLDGKFAIQAKQLAEFLSGEVSGLPEGETRPDADLLIIAGSPKPTEPPETDAAP